MKLNRIIYNILLISISVNIILFYNYFYRVKNVTEFNSEFKCSFELIYGEWVITEYLGGGMPEFSNGDKTEILKGKERKNISLYPDYAIVDGVKEQGNIFILFRIVPEDFIYEYIMPWNFIGDTDTELKCKEQDFYLLGDIITSNDKIEELLNYRTERWFVKDSNTIIIANLDGFYKLERNCESIEGQTRLNPKLLQK